jgi:DNA-binding response OmpR family regulator
MKLSVPVIAVTAQTFFNENKYLENKGFSGYISKPFLINTLLEVIHSCNNELLLSVSSEIETDNKHDYSNSLEVSFTYILSLSAQEKQYWLDALEMTDMDLLFELSKDSRIPIELKNSIHNNDFKFLLQLDEKLNNSLNS